jgi:hypothetical protein
MKTRLPWVIAGILLIGLLGTNGYWLYRGAINIGDEVSRLKYEQIVEHDLRSVARDAMLALPAAAADVPREELLQRILDAVNDERAYEKEGAWVVGSLTLRFGKNDRLVEVRSVWEPCVVFTDHSAK